MTATVVIAVVFFVIGGGIAWALQAARAKAAHAALRERETSLRQQYDERIRELDSLKAQYQTAQESLRVESERRATAEARAALQFGPLRLPGGFRKGLETVCVLCDEVVIEDRAPALRLSLVVGLDQNLG